MDGWMNGWAGGWIDGWMDGQVDGWMNGLLNRKFFSPPQLTDFFLLFYDTEILTATKIPSSISLKNQCSVKCIFIIHKMF